MRWFSMNHRLLAQISNFCPERAGVMARSVGSVSAAWRNLSLIE
jgi:hypothetical protein